MGENEKERNTIVTTFFLFLVYYLLEKLGWAEHVDYT